MQELDPIAMLSILMETLGMWFWVLLAVAVVLLLGVIGGAVRLRRARASLKRPIRATLIIGVLATLVAYFLIPRWSQADPGSFRGGIDYITAVLLALVPGAMTAALVFSLAARQCASRVMARK